jgi:hypothetical protein
MAKDVNIGDNVAIKCQTNTNEDYWILLCDKGLHMVEECFTDRWGQEWFPGDWVIQGVWYERLRLGNMSYILCEDSPPAFVFSHLIIAFKFNMPPITYNVQISNAIYELTANVMGII